MKHKNILSVLLAAVMILVGASNLIFPVSANESNSNIQTSTTNSSLEINADIRKRTEWTDESNGDGKITLQYKSSSNELTGLKKMNVVLVQDKSGSMDSNYGYNLEVTRKQAAGSWKQSTSTIPYPVRLFSPDGKTPWTEGMSYISTQSDYLSTVNSDSKDSVHKGFRDGYYTNGEMAYSSPCQADGHYYLTVKDDTTSNLPAWSMVSGKCLYNVSSTDYHHYKKINADERTDYLNKNCRVVRLDSGNKYYDYENGSIKEVPVGSDSVYFADISQLVQYDGKWILSACGDDECKGNDRLSKSQKFLKNMVEYIKTNNPNSEIAYIPFWGDVPNNGSWSNASGNSDGKSLIDDNENRMTYKKGATKIDFTNSYDTIENQIDDSFTYDGTNWNRAFKNTLDYLNANNKANNLVLFLTDGMPQGTAGKQVDLNNPYINGDEVITYNGTTKSVIEHLQDVASVYACGVCINKADMSNIAKRMKKIDSKQQPVYVDTLSQFDEVENKILARLNEEFKVNILGEDAFYKDTISDLFELDIKKLQKDSGTYNQWRIIDSPSSNMIKGVPENVYNAAYEKGVKYVYVSSTKTVYWYIGGMTDGDYDVENHTVSFPITYKEYNNSTNGDIALKSNTEQKLTYVTSLDENTIQEKTMDSPQIIFNRNEPSVTITKQITGTTFSKDMSFRFVYSTKKQTNGIVNDPLGEITVTVEKEKTVGSAVISNINPGTYYFYEVDGNNKMISPQVQEVTVSRNAEITTVAADASIPHSATSSENETLDNLNNVLRITGDNKNISFTNEYLDLSVNKVWDDQDYVQRPNEVTVWLLKDGQKIQSMKLSANNNWQGTFKNLEKYDASGKKYSYTVKEEEVIGYTSNIEQSLVDENVFTITNKLLLGKVKIHKLDYDGKTPLEGVTFELKDEKNNLVATKTSGSDGEILFENILPGKYTITETHTSTGHTLLKEPIEVTVPMELSKDEIDELNIAEDKYVSYPESNKYLIYDFTYEVTNSAILKLPITGRKMSMSNYIPLITGFTILCMVVIKTFCKKKDG